MGVSPNLDKQEQEVILSRKLKKIDHRNLIFNDNVVNVVPLQKTSRNSLRLLTKF